MKYIIPFEKFINEYLDTKEMKHAKKVLPTKKLKHSKRVAELTKLIKDNKDIYSAAVYHDFLERGGDIKDMSKILSPYALLLVKDLTNENDEDTYTKLKNSLVGKTPSFVNDILTIKLCDRTDNLKKRVFKNSLNKGYLKKSSDLIQFIYDTYSGDKQILLNFMENQLFPNIPSLKEKLIL